MILKDDARLFYDRIDVAHMLKRSFWKGWTAGVVTAIVSVSFLVYIFSS